jgi:hypothetical protein
MKPFLAKRPRGARHVPLLCSKSVCSLFAEISHTLLVLRQTTTVIVWLLLAQEFIDGVLLAAGVPGHAKDHCTWVTLIAHLVRDVPAAGSC